MRCDTEWPSVLAGREASLLPPTLLFPPSKLLHGWLVPGLSGSRLPPRSPSLLGGAHLLLLPFLIYLWILGVLSNWTSHRPQYSTTLLISHLTPNLLLFKYDNFIPSVLLRPPNNQHNKGANQSVINMWCSRTDAYVPTSVLPMLLLKIFVSSQHIQNKVQPFINT